MTQHRELRERRCCCCKRRPHLTNGGSICTSWPPSARPATALSARAQNVASLEVRVVALLRDLGLRMIMIDEVHNLLAGTHREQRRFLNVLRYLSNELEVSLVCLGVSEAVDAIRGDIQLARRLDEHHLPNWRDDAEFSDMIQTLIAAMPLEKKSNLKVKSLKQILGADRRGDLAHLRPDQGSFHRRHCHR